jgi:putative heme-binding domain-containing protein
MRLLTTLSLSAVLLVSKICISSAGGAKPEVAHEWTFEKGSAGWQEITQVELSTRDGLLSVVGTGGDPHFGADVKAPAGWKLLRIQARFQGRLNGQVFWAADGKRGTSEAMSVRFDANSAGEKFRKIDVYFKPEQGLTQLRIDPHNGKCSVEICSIALLNEAPPAPKSTPVSQIKMAKGFKVELLYSVPDEQGSWVSLTTDPKGRLITSDQYGKLYRITPPAISGKAIQIEVIDVDLGMAQGLLWAFDSLYVMVNGKDPGLYRVRDTDGDDKLDEVKLLREIRGASEHGPHAVILSPDGESLYVCGGNHTDIPDPETSRLPRNWAEDQLLPRMWDAGGHAVGKLAPGGWIAKTDPDGSKFELIAAGFRNEYDIAFNTDGELFTYDADMEWDVGTPWYRPTRINHVVSGAEFGWRSGTGKFPEYYPDSLGSVVDIGPGSPTGIVFGTGAKFPAKYQKALFICDWSYGVLYAVHMTPDGATYTGEAERFVSGTPLPLTDIVINPKDQAMYFTIGGRRTQSGLYRVTYVGKESTSPPPQITRPPHPAVAMRHSLEAFHTGGIVKPALIFQGLRHEDRHVRYAARIALEHIPVKQWGSGLLASPPEMLVGMAIAGARSVDSIPEDQRPFMQARILEALAKIPIGDQSERMKLDILRAMSLQLIRAGEPSDETRKLLVSTLNPLYPAKSTRLNRELSQLLIYLNAPKVIPRTLVLLENAATQEEQMQLALWLRTAKDAWSLDDHKRYFAWFNKAAAIRGGHSLQGFLGNIRNEAIARLSVEEKEQLKETLAVTPDPAKVSIIEPRELVKKWTVAELLPVLQTKKTGRDFENGRKMFAQGACFKCHRFAREGGIVGPVLDAVGRRFNDRDMLDAILEPSKVVSDQYQATTFVLESGKSVTGRIANLSGKNYLVSENMLDPGRLTPVNRDEVEELIPSPLSQMPTGLVDTLTEEEILDLIAYLRSGGNPDHEAFK